MKNQFSKYNFFFIIITITCLVTATSVYSQPKKGMYGLSTTIAKGFIASQNISTMGGILNGSLNIGMAYMPSDQINLRGELGYRLQKDTSGTKSSEYTFTGNMWYYLQTSDNVSTFLGGALGFGSASDAAGKGTSLLSLSSFFGAEYWFSQHFSCYGHIGLVYASYTVAERPAWDVFTTATTGLTWYF